MELLLHPIDYAHLVCCPRALTQQPIVLFPALWRKTGIPPPCTLSTYQPCLLVSPEAAKTTQQPCSERFKRETHDPKIAVVFAWSLPNTSTTPPNPNVNPSRPWPDLNLPISVGCKVNFVICLITTSLLSGLARAATAYTLSVRLSCPQHLESMLPRSGYAPLP